MRLDENSIIINEKALKLINELICYDDIYAAGTDPKTYALATLGIARGDTGHGRCYERRTEK